MSYMSKTCQYEETDKLCSKVTSVSSYDINISNWYELLNL